MERVVIEMRKPKRLEHVGCVVCGTHEGEIAACPGCALTQYCGDECRHADARAGHEQICGLFQLLFAVARSEKVRASHRIFQTSGKGSESGDPIAQAYGLAASRAMTAVYTAVMDQSTGDRSDAHGGGLLWLVAGLLQWGASSRIAPSSRRGDRYAFKRGFPKWMGRMGIPTGDPHSFRAVHRERHPGAKWTSCCALHFGEYEAMSKSERKQTHCLPCGSSFTQGLAHGIMVDTTHAPVRAPLSDLVRRDMQDKHCSAGCNTTVWGGREQSGKTKISNCFYSFCFGEVVNTPSSPGAVSHCAHCGICRDYMYGHCERCNTCSYGLSDNVMPAGALFISFVSTYSYSLCAHLFFCLRSNLVTWVIPACRLLSRYGLAPRRDRVRTDAPGARPVRGIGEAERRRFDH
jgi:hypothetical protein